MAITSTSQILSTSKVATATSFLDDAIGYLTSAKGDLETAAQYASYDNFHTDQGTIFPENTESLIDALDSIIISLGTLRDNVNNKAASINSSEWQEYNNYKESQEDKGGGVTTLPYAGDGNYYVNL